MRAARKRAAAAECEGIKGDIPARRESARQEQSVTAIDNRLRMCRLGEIRRRIIPDEHNVTAAVRQLSDGIGKAAERILPAAVAAPIG